MLGGREDFSCKTEGGLTKKVWEPLIQSKSSAAEQRPLWRVYSHVQQYYELISLLELVLGKLVVCC